MVADTANSQKPLFAVLSVVLGLSAILPLPGADGKIAHLASICPFHALTGLPCPGCGLTRAFVCIGHGHFAESLHWHPIGWLVYAVFVILWARAGLTLMLSQPILPLTPTITNHLAWGGTAVLLIVGIARLALAAAHPALRIP